MSESLVVLCRWVLDFGRSFFFLFCSLLPRSFYCFSSPGDNSLKKLLMVPSFSHLKKETELEIHFLASSNTPPLSGLLLMLTVPAIARPVCQSSQFTRRNAGICDPNLSRLGLLSRWDFRPKTDKNYFSSALCAAFLWVFQHTNPQPHPPATTESAPSSD